MLCVIYNIQNVIYQKYFTKRQQKCLQYPVNSSSLFSLSAFYLIHQYYHKNTVKYDLHKDAFLLKCHCNAFSFRRQNLASTGYTIYLQIYFILLTVNCYLFLTNTK